MRALVRSMVFVLWLSAVACLAPSAVPVSPVEIRSQFYSNALLTHAASILPGRKPTHRSIVPRHRTTTVLWHAPGSQTYIILKMMYSIPGQAVFGLLHDAYDVVTTHLQTMGDGLLTGGRFAWVDYPLSIEVMNANNHQTTWGVLGEVLVALKDYMTVNNHVGAADFTVFDDGTEVGSGTVYDIR